jgi:hypothetical protein
MNQTMSKFLKVLPMRFGCDARRPLRPENEDLDRPITTYFNSSSHDICLEGNQLALRSSSDALRHSRRPQMPLYRDLTWFLLEVA